MLLEDLLQRRLLLLTGKGGVGKSVVGAALAVAAAARGKRVLFVEIDAAGDAEPLRVGLAAIPNVEIVNLEPQAVMDEYVRRKVRIDLIVRKIIESPVYHRFFSAAPGLKELMILGKIVDSVEGKQRWSRRSQFDLVVVDLPATGHGLSLLKVPSAASAAIPVGPVGRQARWIQKALRDPKRTGLVVVAIPEEMAVVEALEFDHSAREEVGMLPVGFILNACHERPMSASQEAEVLRLSSDAAQGRLGDGTPLAEALAAARRRLRQARLTRFYERRVRRGVATPLATLPFVVGPIDGAALRMLAGKLADA